MALSAASFLMITFLHRPTTASKKNQTCPAVARNKVQKETCELSVLLCDASSDTWHLILGARSSMFGVRL